MSGTYVVVFVSNTGIQVYGAYSAAHVDAKKFDMWAWKKRWEAANPGLEVLLQLCWFEMKPEQGHGGEYYCLPPEPVFKS